MLSEGNGYSFVYDILKIVLTTMVLFEILQRSESVCFEFFSMNPLSLGL